MEKTKIIRRLLPCAIYDVERIESWLTDMASEGWHLVGVSRSLNLFRFTQGLPVQVRYRLEPKRDFEDQNEKPESAVREVFEAYGWEAVTGFRQFYIFRTADPNAREIHTDMIVHAEAYKRLCRQHFWSYALILPLIALCMLQFGGDFYRHLAVFGPVHTLLYPVMLLLFVGSLIGDFVRIYGIRKRLKAQIPMNHRKSWKKGAFWRRLDAVLLASLYVIWLLLALVQCGRVVDMQKPLEDYLGDPPIVTIADLCPAGTYRPKIMSSYNTYEQASSLCAPIMLHWMEYAQVETVDGQVYEGILIVDYYETAAPWIARGLAEEYLQEAQENPAYMAMEPPGLDVDYVVGYSSVGIPSVIFCKGNIMICATVGVETGEESLFLLWIERMLKMLDI